MADTTAGRSAFDTFKHTVKRTIIAFVLVDLVLVIGAVAVYAFVFRPQVAKLEVMRQDVLRSNQAMIARIQTVEARLALASGDVQGAMRSSGDAAMTLERLAASVPKSNERELADVKQLFERAKLVGTEVERDPAAAKSDLELIESRLSAMYPALGPPKPAGK